MDTYNNTPLHLAVAQNDYTMVSLLLKKGADPNIANRSGITPISIAKRMSYSKLVKVLLKFGAILPVSETQSNHETAKRRDKQSRPKSTQIIGSDNKEGNLPIPAKTATPLFGSIIPDSHININAEPDAISPADDIAEKNHFKNQLETKIFNVYDAAFIGFKDPLLNAINEKNIAAYDDNGCTALMKASFKGNLELVKGLIEKGAPVNSVDNFGMSAITWAVISNHIKLIKFLHENAGGNIDIPDTQANEKGLARPLVTPLVAATYMGHFDAVEYLLSKGANPNRYVGTGKGRSALMVAAWTLRKSIVKLLLQNGAFVDPEIDRWFHIGTIHWKKAQIDQNAWISLRNEPNTGLKRDSSLTLAGSIPQKPAKRRTSIQQEKLMCFTTEESQVSKEISQMLLNRSSTPATNVDLSRVELHGENTSIAASSVVIQRSNIRRGRASTAFRQGLNLDVILIGF